MPFVNKQIPATYTKGTQSGVVKILETYNRAEQAFIVGVKQLTITASEFEAIFGIASGNEEIDMKNCTVSEQSMGKRRFSEYSTITPKHLKAEILVSMKSNLQQDIEDTVKMIIVHVMACVLFIASSDVIRWWMLRICEDLHELHSYNWGQGVIDYLTTFLQSHPAEQVKGCTTLVQVFPKTTPTPLNTYTKSLITTN